MNLSILNVVPLRRGETYKDAMDSMVELARQAEALGYVRYWIAEHHNTASFASSATALLICHTLEHTKTIRVGAGGVMLPNHSPYSVAEYYGTLETLFPGRVDLGLGRAPGTDMATARVLRRSRDLSSYFPSEVRELEGYFKDTQAVHAYPAAGLSVPLYILGSSTDSAYVAAEMGLPYAFAGHFAPAMMEEAVQIYRRLFRPSRFLDKPYVILGLNVTAADTDEQARMLATTQLQAFINILSGKSEGLLPPVENEETVWDNALYSLRQIPHFGPVRFDKEALLRDSKEAVRNMSSLSLVGSVETLKQQYAALKKKVVFDELMINSLIYDPQAQYHSLALFKQAVDEVDASADPKPAAAPASADPVSSEPAAQSEPTAAATGTTEQSLSASTPRATQPAEPSEN